jgi:hypothetical protein
VRSPTPALYRGQDRLVLHPPLHITGFSCQSNMGWNEPFRSLAPRGTLYIQSTVAEKSGRVAAPLPPTLGNPYSQPSRLYIPSWAQPPPPTFIIIFFTSSISRIVPFLSLLLSHPLYSFGYHPLQNSVHLHLTLLLLDRCVCWLGTLTLIHLRLLIPAFRPGSSVLTVPDR